MSGGRRSEERRATIDDNGHLQRARLTDRF